MSERKKNPHAVALGRLGGLVGGKARAKMPKDQVAKIMQKARRARWARLSHKQRVEQTRNAIKAMVAKRLANLKARKKKQKP